MPQLRLDERVQLEDEIRAWVEKPMWAEREQLLLDAIAHAEDEGNDLSAGDFAGLTGLSQDSVERGLLALDDAGFIDGSVATSDQQIFDILGVRLLERGRRTTGQWPPEDQFAALIQILDQQIGNASDREDRTKLEQLRDAAIRLGEGMVGTILNAWAHAMLGPGQ